MKDQILKLQGEFDHAELTGDLDTLRRLLADDFLSIGPKGFVLDKKAWIGRHAQFKYHSLDSSEVDVRTYGGAAIVRNVQRNRASYQGQEQEHAVRVSQVWVQPDNDWKLAGIQFSPLAQP
jgi:ketosteroid isomerase-like protein